MFAFPVVYYKIKKLSLKSKDSKYDSFLIHSLLWAVFFIGKRNSTGGERVNEYGRANPGY